MNPRRMIAVLIVTYMAAGCTVVDVDTGRDRRPPSSGTEEPPARGPGGGVGSGLGGAMGANRPSAEATRPRDEPPHVFAPVESPPAPNTVDTRAVRWDSAPAEPGGESITATAFADILEGPGSWRPFLEIMGIGFTGDLTRSDWAGGPSDFRRGTGGAARAGVWHRFRSAAGRIGSIGGLRVERLASRAKTTVLSSGPFVIVPVHAFIGILADPEESRWGFVASMGAGLNGVTHDLDDQARATCRVLGYECREVVDVGAGVHLDVGARFRIRRNLHLSLSAGLAHAGHAVRFEAKPLAGGPAEVGRTFLHLTWFWIAPGLQLTL